MILHILAQPSENPNAGFWFPFRFFILCILCDFFAVFLLVVIDGTKMT